MSSFEGERLLAKSVARRFVATTSTLALACVLPAVAHAQETAEEAEQAEEAADDLIVVTGIRQALESAQNIKRNADTFVDAITASDTSALPDRSVSEALQRVPGVSVIRFAGPNDPDHFSVEGSGTVVRGLPFVRSELNNRDVFGASAGGTLGFQDVSPELLGSVQVYKNQTADLIEGGIAGTVDLRTRLPFDKGGRTVSFSAEATYSDFVDSWTPTFSGLLSDTYETEIGEIGILANASFSQLDSLANAVQIGDYLDANGGFSGDLIPGLAGARTQEFERQRFAVAGAAQWESTDGRWLASLQFLRSDAEVGWNENVLQVTGTPNPRDSAIDLDQAVFDEDGFFTSGVITDNSQWRGPPSTAAFFPSTGGQNNQIRRQRFDNNITTDYGFNLKFAPTDRLRFNFDAQYIEATNRAADGNMTLAFFAPVGFNVDASGNVVEQGRVPSIRFFAPAGEGPEYFADPSNFFFRNYLQYIQDNEADSVAFRGDVEYDISDDGFFKSVRGGVRYNDQETLLRESTFSWGAISEVWTGRDVTGRFAPGTSPFGQRISTLQANSPLLPDGLIGTVGYNDFNRDGFASLGLGPDGIVSYLGPLAGSFEEFAQFEDIVRQLLAIADDGNGIPVSGPPTLSDRPGVIAGTPFLPTEISSVGRETVAAYARLDFGADQIGDSDIGLTGNIGLRWVRTSRDISRNITIRPANEQPVGNPTSVAQCDPGFVGDGGTVRDVPGFCQIGDANDIAAVAAFFGDGLEASDIVSNSYNYFLPSLNMRFDVGDGHILRFAASRTMSRPGVTQLRENQNVTFRADDADDIIGVTANGRNILAFQGLTTGQSGNVDLLPQLAWGFDASWEYYFDGGGSVTVGAFYKTIDNFIISAGVADEFTGVDGSTLALSRNTVVNGEEKATLKGFELAYNQFFDFLPGPLSGLGLQANYSFIDANGVANDVDPNLPNTDPAQTRFEIDNDVFPRVSRHNFNLIGLYEKSGFQARVAYNWRSEFQVTPRDVITPFVSIYQPATGQLDASLFYQLSDNFRIGVQGVNLLDDITVTTASSSPDEVRRPPRSFFRNDRRFSFILRGSF